MMSVIAFPGLRVGRYVAPRTAATDGSNYLITRLVGLLVGDRRLTSLTKALLHAITLRTTR